MLLTPREGHGAAFNPEELRQWCRGRIAGYKIPRYIKVMAGRGRGLRKGLCMHAVMPRSQKRKGLVQAAGDTIKVMGAHGISLHVHRSRGVHRHIVPGSQQAAHSSPAGTVAAGHVWQQN